MDFSKDSQADGVECCPIALSSCLNEILAAARVVVRAREKRPAPARVVVNADLSEEVAV